jgi:hypothetical protein
MDPGSRSLRSSGNPSLGLRFTVAARGGLMRGGLGQVSSAQVLATPSPMPQPSAAGFPVP